MRSTLTFALVVLTLNASGVVMQQSAAPGVARNDEAPAVVFERPPLKAEPGFSARLVVPSGTFQDPLSVLARPDGAVWINDDGGVSGDRGGYIWGVERSGRVTKVVDADRGMPMIGVDIAPRGFGRWETNCCGSRRQRSSVRAFANPMSSSTSSRAVVIERRRFVRCRHSADGVCTPFATFDGGPQGLAFSADGSRMFVTVRRGTTGSTGNLSARGAIMSVGPDGVISSTPVLQRSEPMIKRIAVAPPGFGVYGGEIFFADWGRSSTEGSDKPVKWDGTLYRVSRDGHEHLVASGFSNPMGIAFTGHSIYVADINRDGPFLAGKWVADGFLARLDLADMR